MNLSPAAAQAALDYAEELAATGLSSEQYDHYYLRNSSRSRHGI